MAQDEAGATRAVAAAFLGNMAIAVTKALAAVLTGSGAMAAETAHSFADAMNQVLLYVGIRRSVRKPTELHPLGFGKERYFWALVVALMLFFGGGVFSLYQGYERFAHPHELGDATIAFVVLGLAIAFETFSITVALREVRREARATRVPVRRFLRELHDPALRTVLFEDSAALLGLALALAGLGLTVATRDHRFDAAASAGIGLVLVAVAFELARDARALIIGESAPESVREAIRGTLKREPGVDDVLELLVVRMGAKENLVMARLSVDDTLRAGDIERMLLDLRGKLRQRHPDVLDAFLEVNPGRAAEELPATPP